MEESRRCMNEGAAVDPIYGGGTESGIPAPDIPEIRATVEAVRDRCPGQITQVSTAKGRGVILYSCLRATMGSTSAARAAG